MAKKKPVVVVVRCESCGGITHTALKKIKVDDETSNVCPGCFLAINRKIAKLKQIEDRKIAELKDLEKLQAKPKRKRKHGKRKRSR